MKSPIEIVRVSGRARDQLITLKRRTGIEHWHTLCRWALCVSLAEKSIPPKERLVSNNSVEIEWRTFGQEYADTILALLKQRCHQDFKKVDDKLLQEQFKLHLHRGISYLAGNKGLKSVGDLVGMIG